MDKTALAAKLREVALLEGDFTLRSGKKSRYYFDKYLFEGTPDVLRDVARALAAMLPEGTRQLAGVELGGVPLVTAVALESGIPAIFVRKAAKEYGTEKLFEGRRVESAPALIIEDVVTTGGASIEAAKRLMDAGIEVAGVLAVLDRKQGGAEAFAEAGIQFWALFDRDDIGMPSG
ncbi:MAG: orotate phosphoribosyltransferase [bacterium]|jgi:orotate phosphoribosyltransferase